MLRVVWIVWPGFDTLPPHVVHSWLSPTIGILKVNVDGATTKAGGISCVIKDFRGNVFTFVAKRIHATLAFVS